MGLDLIQIAGMSGSSNADYKEQLNNDLVFWFNKLFYDMADALKSLGNLIFNMVFEKSPIGAMLKAIIKFICQMVMFIINDVWKGFLCPLVEKLAPPMLDMVLGFLSFIDAIVQAINSIACAFQSCLPDAKIIQRAMQKVQDVKTSIENDGLGCSKRMDDLCFPDIPVPNATGALPVATSCWAGYQSYAGELFLGELTRMAWMSNPHVHLQGMLLHYHARDRIHA